MKRSLKVGKFESLKVVFQPLAFSFKPKAKSQTIKLASLPMMLMCAWMGSNAAEVTVQGARKDALWNSDFVVTNVTAEMGDLATTNWVRQMADGEAEARSAEIAAATNDLAEAVGGTIASATNDLAEAVGADIALATNSLDAATDGKLADYATRAWVESQGYSTGSNMTGYADKGWVTEQGYAPKNWVEEQGYLMATNLAGFATREWVNGRGYLTQHQSLAEYATTNWVQGRGYLVATNLNGYAKESWVTGKGYATTNWVQGRGYLTQHQSLAEYATTNWVQGKKYLVATNLNGYAKESWVTGKGYATTNWVNGRGYLTQHQSLAEYATTNWVNGKKYLVATNLNGYAKESWVTGKGYATTNWVQGRGYLTQHQSLAEYATTNWVNGKKYLVATNLNGYAKESWVQGRGYLTAADVRQSVRDAVKDAAMQMDGATANRLMMPGDDRWIDGTGAVWQAYSTATWNGQAATNAIGATNWTHQAESELDMPWTLDYAAYTAATGTWTLARTLSSAGPLVVIYEAAGLPFMEGAIALTAVDATNGSALTPRTETENGWYNIPDTNGVSYYVSPLVTTATVARVTNAVDRLARASEAGSGLTTNDVCNIVTNMVEESQWIYYDLPDGATVVSPPHEGSEGSEMVIAIGGTEYTGYNCDQVEDIEYYGFYYMPGAPVVGAAHRPVTRNALGLARLSDLPTNHVTKAELDAAIDAIPEVDTSTLATKQQLQAVSNEAQVVYRLFSGSNVVAEVTNYNSQVNAPQLRLLQLNESNEYFTVWSETNGLARTLAAANSNANEQVAQLRGYCETNYAPRAWSRTTSGLGAEAPSNTTWISTPTTVIAGGLEYAKVAHANGAVWVLSGNGMMNFDPTTNAYLRISADDGTEIFSIEKTDAVTVGAYAEGITVSGNVVTIPVPVVSADHPTMYWRESLESGGWADESEINSRLGGGYEWTGSSGAWVCTAWVTGGLPPSMFFKFTYEQEGSTVIKNGAAVDVSGGIMCTDGIHKCRPVYNNGSITWEVVP